MSGKIICYLKVVPEIDEHGRLQTPKEYLKSTGINFASIAQGENREMLYEIECPDAVYRDILVNSIRKTLSCELLTLEAAQQEAAKMTGIPWGIVGDVIRSKREIDVLINVPSWPEVKEAIDVITDVDGCKAMLKRLARIIYWNTKGKAA